MKSIHKSYLLLHLVVFIWGWTAILGKAIQLPAIYLVWYRLPIAVVGIAAWAWYKNISLKVSSKTFLQFFAIGLVIMLHWITFYGAIRVSNVSITLACFASGSFFTALIEPLIFKRRIHFYEILFGLIVLVAISFLFKIEMRYSWGITLGILSAITSSLFGVLNGWVIKKKENPVVVSFYELLGGFLALSVIACFDNTPWQLPIAIDWLYLIMLGILCTTIPFIISLVILKDISPYTLSLTVNLETVYGIILAYFIFNDTEKMSFDFYVVSVIILVVVSVNALLKKRLSPQ